MLRLIRSSIVVGLVAAALAGGRAPAATDGQADLDKATEAKLNAKSLDDLAEVIRLLQSALEKGLDEGNARFANSLLGSTFIQRGTIVTKLIFASPPNDPKLPDRRKAALEDLEEGLKLSPSRGQAFYYIARLNLLAGGDADRAAEALDKAIELADDDPESRAKALTLRASSQKDPQKKIADLDEAVRIVPHDPVALRTRGLLLAGLGKFEPALADLDKALELAPNHVPTHLVRAVVLTELKKYDEALVCLDKVREMQPGSLEPLVQMARVHTLQDNLQAALHVLNRALGRTPDNVQLLLMRAEAHQRIKDAQKALADVDRVLELRPGLPPAVRYRALLLADSDRFDEAVAELNGLLQKDPKDAPTLLQMAVLHAAEKKSDKAIEFYSAVLAQQPDHWIALRGRGDARLNLGQHEPAIADYEEAIQIRPQDSGLLNNLAWVLATSPDEKLRDGKRAIELAAKACELTEYEQAHILSTLAAGYAETGDFDSAIKWSEKGVEIGRPDQKEPLAKELESYRAGKPWREILSEGERQTPPDESEGKEPEEKEPEEKEPEEKEPEEKEPEEKEPEEKEPEENP